jgi:hypothetical protein
MPREFVEPQDLAVTLVGVERPRRGGFQLLRPREKFKETHGSVDPSVPVL